MVNAGIVRVIGDIIASEADQLILVCKPFLSFVLFISIFNTHLHLTLTIFSLQFMQNLTLMLSSSIAVEWGLLTNDREEVRRDIIGTILRMIVVCILPLSFF